MINRFSQTSKAAMNDQMNLHRSRRRPDNSILTSNNDAIYGSTSGIEIPVAIIQQNLLATCQLINPHGTGSGFLITLHDIPAILTCNHVLSNPTLAISTRAIFEDTEGNKTSIDLHPHRLFLTNMEFDFTVCAIANIPTRSTVSIKAKSILEVPYSPLDINSTKRVVVGATLQIVHHPRGEGKKMGTGSAIKILNRYQQSHESSFLLYNFDTDYGSSGGPIFMAGELVGIHHQRAPADKANRGVLMSAIRPKLLSLWSSSGANSNININTADHTSHTKKVIAYLDTHLQNSGETKSAADTAAAEQPKYSTIVLDPATTLYVNPGHTSVTRGLKEAKRRRSKTIVFRKGIHECGVYRDEYGNNVNYAVVDFPVQLVGEGVDETILLGGIRIIQPKQRASISGNVVGVSRLTLRDSLMYGFIADGGGLRFKCEDLRIEGAKERGLVVWGTRGTGQNIEVRDCGTSGILVYKNGKIVLSGRTTVHNNCVVGRVGGSDFGLNVNDSTSKIQLVAPLTRQNCSTDNGGGGNWGGDGFYTGNLEHVE